MRNTIFLLMFVLITGASLAQVSDEKYIKAENALKKLRISKSYKSLYKSALATARKFPKKAYPYYCAAESAYMLQDNEKFKKKNKKPFEIIRKNLTEAKKNDKDGKTGSEFQSMLNGYQKQLYEAGLKLQQEGFTKGDNLFNIIYKLFDNSNSTYTSLYNAYQDLPDTSYNFKEFDHPRYRICSTGKSAAYMSDVEKQVLYLINLIRMDPVLFNKTIVQKIGKERGYDASDTYYSSLVQDLTVSRSCSTLIFPSDKLYKAAEYHALDMGKTGNTGHTSSDGTSTFTRFERYVEGGSAMAENCQYGPDDAVKVVMQLMIDEGVPSLGHRENIMNCNYNSVGIAQRPHKAYRSNTVMDFMR